MDTNTLLQEYAQNGSEEAFRKIVEAYIDFVYSVAARYGNGDKDLAEEVVQTVFTDLARKAHKLTSALKLGGWLHRHTCFVASTMIRAKQRRQLHEREAIEMSAPGNPNEEAWEQIAPQLDEAVDRLGTKDRMAITLRFFNQYDFRAIGEALEISEDAAQKRVSRALDKLRTILARRGIVVSGTALALTLGREAVVSAPAGLAAIVSATALKSATSGAISLTLFEALTAMKLKVGVATLVLAGLTTPLVMQHQSLVKLRSENQKLATDYSAALEQVQSKNNELEDLRKGLEDLPRLRNEVAQWRRQRESDRLQAARQPAQGPETTEASARKLPGRYIAKDRLAFAGFDTPEAGLQTFTWAAMTGNVEAFMQAHTPEWQAENASYLTDAKRQQEFKLVHLRTGGVFKGLRLVAKKMVSEDLCQVKVRMEFDPLVYEEEEMPYFSLVNMAKVGNEWKFLRDGGKYSKDWQETGEVQTISP